MSSRRDCRVDSTSVDIFSVVRRLGLMGSSLGLLFAGSISVHAAEVKPLVRTKTVTAGTPNRAVEIEADITGAKELYLVIGDGGDGFGCDWADWIEPKLVGPKGELKLTDLKWKLASADFGQPTVNKNAGGGALSVNHSPVTNGIGTHANSVLGFDLPEGYTKFVAKGGLDDGGTDQGCGSTVEFMIYTQKPTRLPSGAGGSHDLEAAVGQLDTPDDLQVTLFAGEPSLLSPSNIDIDHLGRVWVCEVVNYRRHNGERPEGDRILIVEDTNHDGVADKTTVFYQGRDVDSAHGICVLGDRVIISAGDAVFSLFDRDGDSKADANSKQLLFTGLSGKQHDHGIHAFVFGPDGKLYFNFGNEGHQLKDADGNPVVDLSGNPVNNSRKPYQEGMVFRCDLDGKNVETLGWNFRNNWEMCVDSFGTMWQSDNDDDGNRGVRINYVMEFGNYGYKDEFTGAGWPQPRTNMEVEIPSRHWHLNDPGVVPNLLMTGGGSPTGICVYEGSLLPERFRNQIIHCDAGPNIVRAYPVKTDGAGYTATIENILEGTRDRWFRPSDVCVAPDGSLIIADWYDPGVGGHGMGDTDRGRLFRITPKGATGYTSPAVNVSTVEGAIAALESPNQATRYLGYTALQKMGPRAVPALKAVFDKSTNARLRARALWLLSQDQTVLSRALADADPEIKVVALRCVSETLPPKTPATGVTRLEAAIAQLASDPSAAVRRECAIALHLCRTTNVPLGGAGWQVLTRKAELWAILAAQYDGTDRWYLEALGIGAAADWDECLAAYQRLVPSALTTRAGRNIIWRSRSTATPGLLAKIIRDPQTPVAELPAYFRALDFLTGQTKDAAVEQLAFETRPSADGREKLILMEAFARMNAQEVGNDPQKKLAIQKLADASLGTPMLTLLVKQFHLTDRYAQLLTMAEQMPDEQVGVDAMKLLLDRGQQKLIETSLTTDRAIPTLRAVGNTETGAGLDLLTHVLEGATTDAAQKQEAVRGLAKSPVGAQRLLAFAEKNQLAPELMPVAAFALHAANHNKLKAEIAKVFPLPPGRNEKPLPPIRDLIASTGNATRGKAVFDGVGTCAKCHIVNNQGKDVGPNLSEIGSKLSREAMFESILFPSTSISHNYESYSALLEDGTVLSGLMVSQTDSAVTLKGADGLVRTVERGKIEQLEKSKVSLMPADLQKLMTAQELVDVVDYLQTLKKPN